MVKRGGSLNPAKFPDETFELLSIPAFDKNKPEILKGAEIGSSKNCIEPRDVLLSKIVPHIRRCWVVPEKGGYRQIGSGEWIIFRDERFYPGFLKHYFTSELFHRQFMNTVAGVGGSLVRARPAGVERIEIPLPPLEEQKRIATILDKADAIRRKRQQAIQLAEEFLRAVFLDMFGDPVTNPKGWKVKKIDDLCEVQGGLQVSKKRSELSISAPYLRVANVLRNRLYLGEIKEINLTQAEYDRVRLKRDDVLIVEGHGNPNEIGRSALWTGEIDGMVHQNHLIRVRVKSKEIRPRFVNDYINSPGGRVQMMKASNTTSGLNTISTGIVKSTEIIVPPIYLQDKYMSVVSKFEDVLVKSRMHEGGIDSSLFSLIKKAFKGNL
ncbi:MAG: hypothetical protein AOY29_11150 [Alcanivorax borkumensis]|nr:MAG: hypothetical protein AOY29_11150 [Alcanivorax borkumensis]